MKLEMTLPERPGLLHAIPLCDLFLMLWLLFLLGSSLVRQTGVAIDLPPSQFQLGRYEDSFVITLGPGERGSSIHFGRDVVTLEELVGRLEVLRSEGAQANSVVLLQTDAGTPVGLERQVVETVLGKGFRVALIGSRHPGKPEASGPESSPEPR